MKAFILEKLNFECPNKSENNESSYNQKMDVVMRLLIK